MKPMANLDGRADPVTGDAVAADARTLPTETLERLRRRAVASVESGMPQQQVADMFGVSRKTVGNWVRAYRLGGAESLRAQKRGRRRGEQLALSMFQQRWVVKTMACGPPDEVGLPHRLWTRRAIAELVSREFGIALNTATIGHYLIRWGLVDSGNQLARLRDASVPTVPPPRSPGTAGAEVLWAEWTQVPPTPAGDRLAILKAFTNRGVLYFLAGQGAFSEQQLTDFHERLRVQLGREARVVVCSWPLDAFPLLSWWVGTGRDVSVRVSS